MQLLVQKGLKLVLSKYFFFFSFFTCVATLLFITSVWNYMSDFDIVGNECQRNNREIFPLSRERFYFTRSCVMVNVWPHFFQLSLEFKRSPNEHNRFFFVHTTLIYRLWKYSTFVRSCNALLQHETVAKTKKLLAKIILTSLERKKKKQPHLP